MSLALPLWLGALGGVVGPSMFIGAWATGALPRAGLTISDLWVAASAIAIATGRIEPAR